MRRLLITFAVIVIVFATATAHADPIAHPVPITYNLNGTFLPLTEFGPYGTLTGEITVSSDNNGMLTPPDCIDAICRVRVFLSVENLVVNDDGRVFEFSDPQTKRFDLGETTAGEPVTLAFEELFDSSGDNFELILDMSTFVFGPQAPEVCGFPGSCIPDTSASSSINASDGFSQEVLVAKLTPVPGTVPEPSTLSLLGIGALGLLIKAKRKFLADQGA